MSIPTVNPRDRTDVARMDTYQRGDRVWVYQDGAWRNGDVRIVGPDELMVHFFVGGRSHTAIGPYVMPREHVASGGYLYWAVHDPTLDDIGEPETVIRREDPLNLRSHGDEVYNTERGCWVWTSLLTRDESGAGGDTDSYLEPIDGDGAAAILSRAAAKRSHSNPWLPGPLLAAGMAFLCGRNATTGTAVRMRFGAAGLGGLRVTAGAVRWQLRRSTPTRQREPI